MNSIKLVENFMTKTLDYNYKLIKKLYSYVKKYNIEYNIILDLGANIGIISLLLSCCFENSIIHAFEPIPETFKILNKNIKLNKRKNIITHNFGIGSKEGEFKMGIPKSRTDKKNIGLYSLKYNNEQNSYKDTLVNVKIKKLNNFDQAQIIKIDIEGGEEDFLSDNIDYIKNVSLILIEFNPSLSNIDNLYRLLNDNFVCLNPEDDKTKKINKYKNGIPQYTNSDLFFINRKLL